MKQVTIESVKQRIQQLTKSAGRNDAYQISINEERELACLRELVAVTEQRDAVVVENVALKKVISDVQGIYYKSDGVAGYHLNGQIATWDEVMPDLWEIETPATDAARSSLRAEGVEMLLTENFKAEIAAALADFDCVDDVTLQTVIWSGQPPEPDGDVWHIEYMTRGYQVQKKIRDFARQLRESKGANHA